MRVIPDAVAVGTLDHTMIDASSDRIAADEGGNVGSPLAAELGGSGNRVALISAVDDALT